MFGFVSSHHKNCRVFSRHRNDFNVFSLFLWSRDIEFLAVQSRNFKLCVAWLFSSFYGVVFEVFSGLTAAVARLF